MTLLSRILHRMPVVQRLEKECDRLRSEQNSALLKMRATSAKMGVLDEQIRMLRRERDREAKKVEALTAEHERIAMQLRRASEACEAMTEERDGLVAVRDTLTAQRDGAMGERDRLALEFDRYRRDATPDPCR